MAEIARLPVKGDRKKSDIIAELNARYAVIGDIGGKCRVISETLDPILGRPIISYQTFEDFRNRLLNQRVHIGDDETGRPKYKPAGHYWLGHAKRRQYDRIVFSPNRDVDGAYNLWRGYGVVPRPGDKHAAYLEHIYKNICSGDVEHYTYVIGWIARMLQQPSTCSEVAIVLRGKRGTGKGVFVNALGKLLGAHYFPVSSSKHIFGDFNRNLMSSVLVFSDEAFYAGDKKHESMMKTLITEPTLVIEGKGRDAILSPNFTHIIMASNSQWVVPAGDRERRFFVLDVADVQIQDHNYFGKILADLADGGYENLLHFFLSRDISGFEVRNPPRTRALQDQQVLSMSQEEQWLFNILSDGLIAGAEWPEKISKDVLYEDYLLEVKELRRYCTLSKVAFGKFLSSVMPSGYPKSRQERVDIVKQDEFGVRYKESGRGYVYVLPSLESVREMWDRDRGGPFEWNRAASASASAYAEASQSGQAATWSL